ncbi:CoA transferase [Acidiferrimicrobium sp. IK]|uniref:CaiB/BaiF CoA transferase family protein n=1 Tax=Acidiferrimicrobium sp. IK TaxID=2871700 RepID=UPI0021CAE36A|nr:CoA transferase [Acidiferrimicrobium sp. IK]MCU4183839.1 CoA transferase [Acidiferrimicrobium sp. IK]
MKVLELAHLLAGPFAGTLLGDLGADVIHVEAPGTGDPMRNMGLPKGDEYLWWRVTGRNKRSVTLDLRQNEGRDVARKLAAWADVVITNLRPGTLDEWGLSWEDLHTVKPKLIMLQVSGYGAQATKRNLPGYGKVGEARSGIVHISGFPDGPPVHAGFSHADTVTPLMGVFGVMCAVYRKLTDPDFRGEWIDLGIDESLYRLIEWQVVMYDQLGIVPERVGNGIPGSPGGVVNAFKCSDGRWLTVTSGTIPSIQNIAALVGENVEEFSTRPLIIKNRERLEAVLADWAAQRTADECMEATLASGVVATPVLDVSDIVADETFQERGNIVTVDDPILGPLRMQGVIPRLANHTGGIFRQAPLVPGQDNDEVYLDVLGLGKDEYSKLKAHDVI